MPASPVCITIAFVKRPSLLTAHLVPFISSFLLVGGLATNAAVAQKAGRASVSVRSFEETDKLPEPLRESLAATLDAEIRRYPALQLVKKTPDKGATGKHYELTLRILRIERSLAPETVASATDKQTITCGLSVAILFTSWPVEKIALGGEGEAALATELRHRESADQECQSLMRDATREAIAQALEKTFRKIRVGGAPAKPSRH